MHYSIIIIGAGQAGSQCAHTLREKGFTESIAILGDENYLPYQRPPLSKAYLRGDLSVDRLYLRAPTYFSDRDVDVYLSCLVTEIDTSSKKLTLSDGRQYSYDRLIFANGSRNKRLPFGKSANQDNGIIDIRSITDTDKFRSMLDDKNQIVVIGGGYIGLEVAASILKLGKRVTLIEAAHQLMSRTATPALAEFVSSYHLSKGLDLRLAAGISGYTFGSGGSIKSVELANGEELPANMVVEGVGAVANSELAEEAGIKCSNGIEVDDNLQTSTGSIYAIGDVACFYSHRYDARIRLESVNNAIEQANYLANFILAEQNGWQKPPPFDLIPWFWTEQFDLKIQTVGFAPAADKVVVRGSVISNNAADAPSFSMFQFVNNQLLAVDSINRAADHMACRRILASGSNITPQQAADESIPLKSYLR